MSPPSFHHILHFQGFSNAGEIESPEEGRHDHEMFLVSTKYVCTQTIIPDHIWIPS